MSGNEQPAGLTIDVRETLAGQSKESLVILARKLRVRHARKFSKNELIDRILLLPESTVRRALHITWWDKWHNHVYGIATILSLLLAAISFFPQPSDYIEGTMTTRAKLKESLPFGYVIFYFKREMFISQQYPDTRLEWKCDWSQVAINPNFTDRTVKWTIPNIDASFTEDGKTKPVFTRIGMSSTVPMKLGLIYPMQTVMVPNEPRIYVGTFSDNQKTPIFVLGFRIDGFQNR